MLAFPMIHAFILAAIMYFGLDYEWGIVSLFLSLIFNGLSWQFQAAIRNLSRDQAEKNGFFCSSSMFLVSALAVLVYFIMPRFGWLLIAAVGFQ